MRSSLLAIVLSLICLVSGASVCTACESTERLSLLSFLQHTSGSYRLKWNTSGDCCLWDGVSCDTSGRITRLLLASLNLTGTLSAFTYPLNALADLNISGNHLTGEIPSNFFSSLTALVSVDLSFNAFSGELPASMCADAAIGGLNGLAVLELNSNNFTGEVPGNLSLCTNLTTLRLRRNSFTGDISAFKFSNLEKLVILDLGDNNFSGTLPAGIYSCKRLTALRLASNRLEGEISWEIESLQSLSYLSLSLNNFRNIAGAIKVLSNCKNLTTLLLAGNFAGETLPAQIAAFNNLRLLGIGGSKLQGKFPGWIRNLTNLEVLDLSENRLTGSIPASVGKLQNLFYMDLSGNLFSGDFPPPLCELPALTKPPPSTRKDYLQLPVFVTTTDATYQPCNQIRDLPPGILLRNNTLSGRIPTEIGRIKFVNTLDFSYNNFSGEIPPQISNLTVLEKLDLSHNRLSGEIPDELKNLGFLSFFTVAYNDLSGAIPSGGRLETFSISSFEGNRGLCGRSLKKCDMASTIASGHERAGKTKSVLIAVFSVGCLLTAMVICVFASRRIVPLRSSAHREEKVYDDTGLLPAKLSIEVCPAP